MTPAGIEGCLDDDVGRLVGRDVDTVEEAAACRVGEVDQDAVDRRGDIAGCGDDGRILYGDAKPERFVKVGDEPDLPVARVVEPDDVEVVDRQRRILLARDDAHLVLREQTPRLASKKMKAAVGVVVAQKGLPEARRPIVGFNVVGICRHAQEVGFDVGGQALRGIDLALCQQRKSGPRALA
jgi:hypothetical protein